LHFIGVILPSVILPSVILPSAILSSVIFQNVVSVILLKAILLSDFDLCVILLFLSFIYFLVGWHAGAVSLPPVDIILT
jgi:hypothetical protein